MSFRIIRRSLLSLAAITAGCATGVRQPSRELTGVEWRLAEIDGVPVVATTGGREPHIRLAADSARVTGFTTCNAMFGRYDAPGRMQLRFSQLGSTKMACVDPVLGRQEQQFMAALKRVERYALVRDMLILFDGKYTLARFVPGQRR
jgi:heat shock protein HslJ